MKATTLKPLLTTEEAARQLSVSPETLETWRVRRPQAIPYVKIGRLVRYRPQDLAAYVDRHLCAA